MDEHGDVDCLGICNLWPTTPIEKLLPKSSFIAIKGPYYKVSLEETTILQVDHPSDLVFFDLSHGGSLLPSLMLASTEFRALWEETTAVGLKAMGNTAFKKGDWELAVKYYTAALNKLGAADEADPDLKCDVYRNRAGARIHLGQYEQAYKDALAAIIVYLDSNGPKGADRLSEADVKSKNTKAYFRAGVPHTS